MKTDTIIYHNAFWESVQTRTIVQKLCNYLTEIFLKVPEGNKQIIESIKWPLTL